MGKLIRGAVAVAMMVCWVGVAHAVTYTNSDSSFTCAFFTKKEARKQLGERRGHVVMCSDRSGNITGAVLSKTGKIRCEITGHRNPRRGHSSVIWCGEPIDFPSCCDD